MNRTFLDAHIAKRHSDVSMEPVAAAAAAAAARPVSAAAAAETPPVSQPSELDSIARRLQQAEQRLIQETDARNEAEFQVPATFCNNCLIAESTKAKFL